MQSSENPDGGSSSPSAPQPIWSIPVMTRLWVIAALTVAVVAACDRVPLTSPTGSTISLTIDKSILPINGQATVTAVVTESSGTPVHNGTTVTFQTSLGRMEPTEAQTVNGKAVATFLAGSISGTASVSAFSGGARTSGNGSSGGIEIKVGTAGADRISVRTEPNNIPISGGTVQVIAGLFDISNNPIISTPLTFTSDFGTLSANTAFTDGNGEARVQLTTNRTTRITVSAGGTKATEFALNALSPPTVTITCGSSGNASAGSVGAPLSCTIRPTSAPAPGNGSSSAPIQNVTISWGDGTGEQPLGAIGSGTDTTAIHTYLSTGSYAVTASATDVNGQRGSTTITVTVTRSQPAVTLTPPSSNVSAGETVVFSVSASSVPGGPPIQNVTVTENPGGAVVYSGLANGSFARQFNSRGTYTLTAVATDAAGTTGNSVARVTVGEPSVTLTASGPGLACTGSPQTCTGMTSPKNVTFTADVTTPGVAGATYQWNWGDGSPPEVTTSRINSHLYAIGSNFNVLVTVTTTGGATATQALSLRP